MNKIGWLVNDRLTCIPNTKTFWHFLLDWIPQLQDKTNGYTDFGALPYRIEQQLQTNTPDYIIRNATFFRQINTKIPTISFLQDSYDGGMRQLQLNVCNSSNVVVFNSKYIYDSYKNDINVKTQIIPIGSDSDLFNQYDSICKEKCRQQLNILEDSILFIGSSDVYPKGFDLILDLIHNTNYNFCLVMKDDYYIDHPRVKVFNKVSHEILVDIINSCKMLICASKMETLHLAGIEAGLCGLPIIATNVGVYAGLINGDWGIKISDNISDDIKYVFNNYNTFDTRKFWYNSGFALETCKQQWIKLISEVS